MVAMMFEPRLLGVGSKSEICGLTLKISVAKESGAGRAKLRKVAFHLHSLGFVTVDAEFRSPLAQGQTIRRREVHR